MNDRKVPFFFFDVYSVLLNKEQLVSDSEKKAIINHFNALFYLLSCRNINLLINKEDLEKTFSDIYFDKGFLLHFFENQKNYFSIDVIPNVISWMFNSNCILEEEHVNKVELSEHDITVDHNLHLCNLRDNDHASCSGFLGVAILRYVFAKPCFIISRLLTSIKVSMSINQVTSPSSPFINQKFHVKEEMFVINDVEDTEKLIDDKIFYSSYRVFEHIQKHSKGRPNLDDGESTLFTDEGEALILLNGAFKNYLSPGDTDRLFSYDYQLDQLIVFHKTGGTIYHGFNSTIEEYKKLPLFLQTFFENER